MASLVLQIRGVACSPRQLTRGLASTLLARSREQLTFNELKKEAKDRGLAVSGGKAALLARLQADDLTRSGISTSSTVNEATPSGSVVAPDSTPVNSPLAQTPRVPFKSLRTIRPSVDSRNGLDALNDENRFQPRRSQPLAVEIPMEQDIVEDGPVVPVVPDNYGSSPVDSASPPPDPHRDAPKVLSVSGLDSHLAAPSHTNSGVFINQSSHQPSTQSSLDTSSLSSSTTTFGRNWGIWTDPGPSTNSDPKTDPNAKLTPEESRGLYVLAGILFGGWALGGLAKKSALDEEH